MSDTIENANRLFAILREIESNDEIQVTDRLDDVMLERLHPGIGELIETVFITPGGNANYGMVNVFEDNGIKVGPGEVDSFGWVTGLIQTQKGTIVF